MFFCIPVIICYNHFCTNSSCWCKDQITFIFQFSENVLVEDLIGLTWTAGTRVRNKDGDVLMASIFEVFHADTNTSAGELSVAMTTNKT